ncbi:MAG: hypothetical protein HY299_03295 [Verrucomicrobia bacterium]|nr:hypothetical protein [Verrucomicrobiota bacterium]
MLRASLGCAGKRDWVPRNWNEAGGPKKPMAPQPIAQDAQNAWLRPSIPPPSECLMIVDWQTEKVCFSGDAHGLGLVSERVHSPAGFAELPSPTLAWLRELATAQPSREPRRIPWSFPNSGVGEISVEILPAPAASGPASHAALLVRRAGARTSDSVAQGSPMDFALFSAMAHEIKNSLVAIKTLVELLLEKDPKLEMARIVRQEVDRIAFIVTQMLSSSAPAERREEAVSLHALIAQVTQLIEPMAQARLMRVESRLGASSDAVRGDRRQLEQAVLNVAMNGLEAMTPGGSLTIRTEIRQETLPRPAASAPPSFRAIVLSIQDTGCGIPRETIDRLYDDFFTTKSRGSGLGLSIARRVMESHGGGIRVQSEPGTGTQFELIFPA